MFRLPPRALQAAGSQTNIPEDHHQNDEKKLFGNNTASTKVQTPANKHDKLSPLTVKSLAECQQYMSLITSWYDDAWGNLRPNQPNYSKDLYLTRLNTNRIPIAYVIFGNGVPVGTFSLVPNTFGVGDPKLTMLNNVYVSKSMRGRGVGKQIMAIAETAAYRTFGLRVLQLGTVELSLVKYYTNLGWTLTGKALLEGNHELYMMQKAVEPPKTELLSKL